MGSIGTTDSNNSNENGGGSPSSMISGTSPDGVQSPTPNFSSTTTTAATTTTSSSSIQNHHNDSTPAEFADKKKQIELNSTKVTVN
jgi:hypothetical protein